MLAVLRLESLPAHTGLTFDRVGLGHIQDWLTPFLCTTFRAPAKNDTPPDSRAQTVPSPVSRPCIRGAAHHSGVTMTYVYIVLALLVVLAASGIRIVQEYERSVVFTLGWFSRVAGPGLFWIIPIIAEGRPAQDFDPAA